MLLGSKDFFGSTMFRPTGIRTGTVRKNVKLDQKNEALRKECSTPAASLGDQGFRPTSIAKHLIR